MTEIRCCGCLLIINKAPAAASKKRRPEMIRKATIVGAFLAIIKRLFLKFKYVF